MAKIWVTYNAGSTRVPFLRGILTRSLLEAGLPFDAAYKASSVLRQRLNGTNQISRDKLRKRVAAYLGSKHGALVRAAYEARSQQVFAVQVRDANGEPSPFSRTQLLRRLESCGLSEEQSGSVVSGVAQELNERHPQEIASQELGRITYERVRRELGESMAHRYLVWVDNQRSGRSLVLLIGGATGTGKSTLATEVADRLGIVRTQSTDMLREVMRMMIPERLLPVLHTSSFKAGKALPSVVTGTEDPDALLTEGYLSQSELLTLPCEAVVQRALKEHVSVILEGVHLHPALLKNMKLGKKATLVMIMLAVLDQDQLRSRLAGRVLELPERANSGYLNELDRIWRLQSFLLSEADHASVPILINDDKEKVTNLITTTIIDELARGFTKSPKEVFA
jgi:2-phosphoglycerate kinase